MSCQLSRIVLGFNISATLTHYMLELLKPLSIILPLVNIDWGSFLEKNFCVHAVYILLNLGDISCTTARDSTITRIQEEILLLTSHCSLNTTVMPSLKKNILLYQLTYSLFSFVIFLFFFLFFFFFFLLLYFSLPHVVSIYMYIVTK